MVREYRNPSVRKHSPHLGIDTDHSKHAQEIARELPLDYDAVVILSGDGLAHEIFNGFAEHADPVRAFSIPLAPVPSGSANGTCLSLLGLKVNGTQTPDV